jgi:hypothetical protein
MVGVISLELAGPMATSPAEDPGPSPLRTEAREYGVVGHQRLPPCCRPDSGDAAQNRETTIVRSAAASGSLQVASAAGTSRLTLSCPSGPQVRDPV